jgi:epoxyqueuosine reductase
MLKKIKVRELRKTRRRRNITLNTIVEKLDERGYKSRIVSVKRLAEMREEIIGRHIDGLFDENFYQQRLEFFDFRPPETLANVKSMIVAAIPRPQDQATFSFGGVKKMLIIPPTYVDYDTTTNRFKGVVNEFLKKEGYSAVSARKIPLKILAVRSGLAEYGRNNVTYVSGMGSFHQLNAIFTDLPCESETWNEAKMMKRCKNCQACINACPTRAVSGDRFLLHAERCISFHNEKKGEVSFPAWLDSSWHNCLYGCMFCQKVCPENKQFLDWIGVREAFSSEETEFLLRGGLSTDMPKITLEKLERLSLADSDSLDNLPRNLRVFFK